MPLEALQAANLAPAALTVQSHNVATLSKIQSGFARKFPMVSSV